MNGVLTDHGIISERVIIAFSRKRDGGLLVTYQAGNAIRHATAYGNVPDWVNAEKSIPLSASEWIIE